MTDRHDHDSLLAALEGVTWRVSDTPKPTTSGDTIPFLERRPGPPGHRIERLDPPRAIGTPPRRKT